MPFRSKSQLRTCYGGGMRGVDCGEWLRKTQDPCCLPEKVGTPPKRSCALKTTKKASGVKTGPRGGKYREIITFDSSGREICRMKIYGAKGGNSSSKKITSQHSLKKSGKCTSKTKAGKRCKNNCTPDKRYCRIHTK